MKNKGLKIIACMAAAIAIFYIVLFITR